MKFFKIIIIIFFKIVFISSSSFALKPCPKNQEAFKDNCFGKYEFSSGENYIGEWKNDKRNGQGTNIWANGKKYVGEWLNNKVHGYGEMSIPDGTVYKGDFRNDIPNGIGIYIWKNGLTYEGEVKNGKMHGHGSLTSKDGKKYVGNFKNGKIDSKIKDDNIRSNLEDGNSLTPCPSNKKAKEFSNCIGETFINGNFYRGSFLNGNPDGVGEIRISPSYWHRGEFKNGEFKGIGARINSVQNSILIGDWKDSKLVKGLSKSDYGIYYGEWENLKFNGEGIFINTTNNKIDFGKWENGKLVINYLDKNYERRCVDSKKSIDNCFAKLGNDNEHLIGFFRNRKVHGLGYMKQKNRHMIGIFKDNEFSGNAMNYNEDNNVIFYGKTKSLFPAGWGVQYNKADDTTLGQLSNTIFGEWYLDGLSGKGTIFRDLDGTNKLTNFMSYYGYWKSNKANGFGLRIDQNGNTYFGNWKEDFPNTMGYFISKNEKYVGQVVKGMKEGIGLSYNKDLNGVEIYTGEFKKNKPNGYGYLYEHKNKKTWTFGIWDNGKLLKKTKRFNEDRMKKISLFSKKIDLLANLSPYDLYDNSNIKITNTEKSNSKLGVVKNSSDNFSKKSINISFRKSKEKPFDIAVIIGNANYEKQGKDIPNVNPAYADAQGIKQYFVQSLGIKEGNIIYLEDATAAQLLSTFGDSSSHKGKLFNWIKPNVSNVYIYYAGHGVPGDGDGKTYLVPSDADAQTIQFSGYPLSTLYSNLGKLPAKSVTVILEACFSGISQSGTLFKKSSRMIITPKQSLVPKNVKVIAAGSPSQMASWEEDNSHSLFTKYFLKAMSGEADKNKDGKINDNELRDYLDETMTYFARRYYGRDQKVQIIYGK